MANPQKEDGYTAISNELMEQYSKLQICGYEWRCLIAILRETYGWNRKKAEMSITRIQQITGLKRWHVSRTIKSLIDKKLVTKFGDSFTATLGPQKDYTKWKSSPKLVTATTVTNSGDSTVTNLGDKIVTNLGDSNSQQNHANSEIAETENKKQYLKQNPDFFSLKKRYQNPSLIDQAFQAIAATRKSGKVAESILLAQLKRWERYPVKQVESGIHIYIEKDCAGQGKREDYLLGIIRNQKPNKKPSKIHNSYQPKYLTEQDIYADGS